MKDIEKIIDSIIGVLGDNHTKTIRLKGVNPDDGDAYGLYTYDSGVYVINSCGDVPFEELELKEQLKIGNIVTSKNWVVDNTIQ